MEYNVKCMHCSRFLATVSQSTTIQLKCSNSKCKKLENYKIKFLTDMMSETHKHKHATVKSDTAEPVLL